MEFAIDFEKELTGRGLYKEYGELYGAPYNPVERLTPPITPRENLRRFYGGESFAWVPDTQSDVIYITPSLNPDVEAQGYAGGTDAFGVKWVANKSNPGLPSFVEPGFALFEDVEDWRTITWQDPDEWDWEGYAARFNAVHEDDDRFRVGIMLSGYFERLISVMTFENAAMALLEDPDSTKEFFEALTVFNMKVLDYYIDYFQVDAVTIHDDWSAQKGPFFSLDIAEEVIAPYIRRLSDHAHERGIFFTLHSCGNGQKLLPAIKATGADAWQAQVTAFSSLESLLEDCGNEIMLELYPDMPAEYAEGDVEGFYRDWIGSLNSNGHRTLVSIYDFNEERRGETRRLVYRIGRELAGSRA